MKPTPIFSTPRSIHLHTHDPRDNHRFWSKWFVDKSELDILFPLFGPGFLSVLSRPDRCLFHLRRPSSACDRALLVARLIPAISGLSFELFHAYRYVRHVQFYEGKRIRRADGRRLIKAWVCALGVLVSTALGAGDDVAVWTPMASSRRPTPT